MARPFCDIERLVIVTGLCEMDVQVYVAFRHRLSESTADRAMLERNGRIVRRQLKICS